MRPIVVSICIIILLCTSGGAALSYIGSIDFPELFKYNDQKNSDIEAVLLSISLSFKNDSIPVTQELLAAIMAILDEEADKDYLPVGEHDYVAKIFASNYIRNDLVSLSNAKDYSNVSKMINTSEGYASDFNMKANAYLMLFGNNPDKVSKLLAWLNTGTLGASTQNATVAESSAEKQTVPGEAVPRVLTELPGAELQVDLYKGDQYVGTQWRNAPGV